MKKKIFYLSLVLSALSIDSVVNCAATILPDEEVGVANRKTDILFIDAVKNNDIYMVEKLIAAGADINTISAHENWSALYIAARSGYLEIVNLLVANGAIIYPYDEVDSILVAASRRGHKEVVEFLISVFDFSENEKVDAIAMAAGNGYIDIVISLINAGFSSHFALPAAASNGHKNIVKLLFDMKIDLKKENCGEGALLEAATNLRLWRRKGHQSINSDEDVVSSKNPENKKDIIKLLLDAKVDINLFADRFKNSAEITPLMLAATQDNPEMVKFLIDCGADVNLVDSKEGNTALLFMLKHIDKLLTNSPLKDKPFPNTLGIIKLLLDAGADLDVVFKNGLARYVDKGPLDIAQQLEDHYSNRTEILASKWYGLNKKSGSFKYFSEDILNLPGNNTFRHTKGIVELIENEPGRRKKKIKARRSSVAQMISGPGSYLFPIVLARIIASYETSIYQDIVYINSIANSVDKAETAKRKAPNVPEDDSAQKRRKKE